MGLDKNHDIVCASEYIPDRLYFVTLRSHLRLEPTSRTYFFSVDDTLKYVNFHLDFGPLNLAMLYRYCILLNDILKVPANASKKIVHYTVMESSKRANAAFLISSYAVMFLNRTPEDAYEPLTGDNQLPFKDFRDAGFGPSLFGLTLLDCLRGLYKAKKFGFVDLTDFDCDSYEYYERVDVGDLNWIIPGKFLAFCGPYSRECTENGYIHHAPETYIPYFRRCGVTAVVRLNKRMYSGSRFSDAGIEHHDLFFPDGSTPSAAIMHRFIDICERSRGAIAVHCKAGLGRTGSLISCYMMKHYRMSATECIAWLRMCRPGSVLGHQQLWLLQQQRHLQFLPRTTVPQRCAYGVYSVRQRGSAIADCDSPRLSDVSVKDISSNISNGMGSIRLCESDTDQQQLASAIEMAVSGRNLTQGDQLTRIKALRQGSNRAPVLLESSNTTTSRSTKTRRGQITLSACLAGSSEPAGSGKSVVTPSPLRPPNDRASPAQSSGKSPGSDLRGRRSSAASIVR